MGAFDPEYLKKAFDRFGRTVVDKARNNLSNQGKSVSGKLSKSLDYSMKESASGDSFSFSFLMEKYGEFQDKGVSGIKKKYNTPYSYKSKGGLKGMPPPSKLDKWTVKKGIAPRDEKGRFMSRKSLQFAIARSIFYNGIRPSLFFTKPFLKYSKELPNELEQAFALDAEAFLEFTTKQQLNG